MSAALASTVVINGLILGWSVAWPPGPVNAEMIRRGALPRAQGGGFWAAMRVGFGACLGDFLWALGVSAGAGAIIDRPAVRQLLGVISLCLLLFLAWSFARNAWRIARTHKAAETRALSEEKTRRRLPGFLLGFTFTLTSPWNVGFWTAVIGSQSDKLGGNFLSSVVLATAVVGGALAWGIVLASAVKLGARIFSRPSWQIATQALSAAVMLYFAAQLVLRLW